MPFVVLSLDEMYKEVLGWDLYVMLSGRPMYQLRDVPERFSSVDEYLDVFEPLLLEECRAQTLRSLYEMTDSRDHHLQLKLVEPLEPFRLLQFESPNREGEKSLFFETDLVFVSHEPLDLDAVEEDANGETRTVPQQFHALAIVVNSTTSGTLMLKVYLPEDPTSRLPPSQHKRLQLLRKVMVPASGKWYVRKLGNMVTINREFQALYVHAPRSRQPRRQRPAAAAEETADAVARCQGDAQPVAAGGDPDVPVRARRHTHPGPARYG